MSRRQSGFGLVTAVFLMVVLAVLGAGITFFVGTQRNTVTLDLLGDRAYQAARSGIEWGAYKALQSGSCVGSTNVTFPNTSLSDFTATVTCVRTPTDPAQSINEGGIQNPPIVIYSLTSKASNGDPASATYVERQLTALVGG